MERQWSALASYRVPRVTTDTQPVASIAPQSLHTGSTLAPHAASIVPLSQIVERLENSKILTVGENRIFLARLWRDTCDMWSQCGAILATCCASVAQQHFLYAFLPRKHFLTRDCRGKWPRFQSQAEIADEIAMCDPSLTMTSTTIDTVVVVCLSPASDSS